MAVFENLVGYRFGSLVVIERVENGKHGVRFLCVCDCGKEKTTYASTLKGGMCISCGCRKSLSYGEGAFRSLYRYTKLNAKYRHIDFALDIKFFRWITSQDCTYCGVSPHQSYKQKRNNGEYIYNGIDRVDNKIGYLPYNCVPCCGYCNRMKSADTISDFRDWIVQVYEHWASH